MAQNNISGYRYWFDEDFGNVQETTITPVSYLELNTILDGNSLVAGLHVLNFQFKDESGKYSSVLSRFFTKMPSSSVVSASIVAWEYWFDSDYANVSSSTVTPTDLYQLNTIIDGSSLSGGVHTLNLRFKDSEGNWSSVLSRFVVKTAASVTMSNQIVTWEYWFDTDYANIITQSTTNSPVVNINSLIFGGALSNGLHVLNLRFKDENNSYSSVLSKFVIKTPITSSTPDLITSYRYWINDGDSAMVVKHLSSPTSIYQLTTSISLAHLPQGDYQINIQFKDSLQHWSSVLSDSIHKNTLPVAMFSGETLIFCDSSTVQFNDQSIDANEWFWTFGDGSTSNDQNPNHQYTTSGYYDVTLTASDSVSGLDSTITFVSYINSYATPDPTITAIDNDSICFGSSGRLVVDQNADVIWSTSATNDTIIVNNEGWYYATLSNPNYNTCIAEDSIYLTVMPMLSVNLGNDTTICDGNNLTLNADNADAWLWSTSETTQSISVSTAGIYFVDIFDELGCNSRDSIELGIDPLAVADFSYIASIGDVDFTSLSSDAIDFDWTFDDGNTSTDENPSNTYVLNGTYHVCLTVSNDCNSDTYCEDITIASIGIEEISSAPVMALYPNPVADQTNLVVSGTTTNLYQLKIHTSSGQLVYEEMISGNTTQQLNLDHLTAGNYLLELSNENFSSTLRFVKL